MSEMASLRTALGVVIAAAGATAYGLAACPEIMDKAEALLALATPEIRRGLAGGDKAPRRRRPRRTLRIICHGCAMCPRGRD